MNISEYGSKNGSMVVYFHGAPGGITECSLFEEYAKKHKLNIICFERFTLPRSISRADYYQQLAQAISLKANGEQVDFIGFSIGCMVAIEVSILLGKNINELHLISAAAPLEAEDFIDNMAGKLVFKLAKNYPTLFTLLSYWQSLLAKISPHLLTNMLFASAKGKDKKLLQGIEFNAYITSVLVQSFRSQVSGYIRDVKHYVQPWNKAVSQCTANTYIWHGNDDNWSPVDMAHYLKKNLTNCRAMELMPELSHYSCLYEAVPKICSQLTRA